jgi:hypothetical protein
MQYIGILKLVQKVKLLLVSQTVDMKNVANYGHQEGNQFEFQSSGI